MSIASCEVGKDVGDMAAQLNERKILEYLWNSKVFRFYP